MKKVYKKVYKFGVFALGWACNGGCRHSDGERKGLRFDRFEPKCNPCKPFSYFFRVREENKKVNKTIEKRFTRFTPFTGKTEAQPC